MIAEHSQIRQDRIHEGFKQALISSQNDVWLVAKWLNIKYGLNVLVPSTSVADKFQDRMLHRDAGDLFIIRDIVNRTVCQRIETKRLGYYWTCRDDWPFRNEVAVCSQHALGNSERQVAYFYFLNNKATHIARIDVKRTCSEWWVKDMYCKNHERVEKKIMCPLHLVDFKPFSLQ